VLSGQASAHALELRTFSDGSQKNLKNAEASKPRSSSLAVTSQTLPDEPKRKMVPGDGVEFELFFANFPGNFVIRFITWPPRGPPRFRPSDVDGLVPRTTDSNKLYGAVFVQHRLLRQGDSKSGCGKSISTCSATSSVNTYWTNAITRWLCSSTTPCPTHKPVPEPRTTMTWTRCIGKWPGCVSMKIQCNSVKLSIQICRRRGHGRCRRSRSLARSCRNGSGPLRTNGRRVGARRGTAWPGSATERQQQTAQTGILRSCPPIGPSKEDLPPPQP